MGRRVFNTEFAPAEEIEGVKSRLEEAGIPFYEIKNSKLWLGGGSLCVSDPDDYERARAAIDEFQSAWRTQAHQDRVKKKINWRLISPLILIFALFIFVTIQTLRG